MRETQRVGAATVAAGQERSHHALVVESGRQQRPLRCRVLRLGQRLDPARPTSLGGHADGSRIVQEPPRRRALRRPVPAQPQ
jgi:hypothetical protein